MTSTIIFVALILVACGANLAMIYYLVQKVILAQHSDMKLRVSEVQLKIEVLTDEYRSKLFDVRNELEGVNTSVRALRDKLVSGLEYTNTSIESLQSEVSETAEKQATIASERQIAIHQNFEVLIEAVGAQLVRFDEQAGRVTAYAKEIIDARSQNIQTGMISRVNCGVCKRLVHSFEKQRDETFKCTDCVRAGR